MSDITKFLMTDETGQRIADALEANPYATTTNAGKVKADGNSFVVDADGTAHAKAGTYLDLVNLGTSYTAELKADIVSGQFKKVRVGGYLTINNHVYYMAHPDYWLHTGNTECTTHHMLVVPAGSLGSAKMNDSNVTTGAYVGSKMYTDYISAIRSIVQTDFGVANILTHRELFTNTVDANGKSSNWTWYDSTIDLMSEVMVYGHNAWGSAPNYETGIDKSQIELFAKRPDLITTRSNWWLRDVVSAASFARVTADGYADYNNASGSYGVRPCFALC